MFDSVVQYILINYTLIIMSPSGNVLKELSEPAGAIIYCSRFKVNRKSRSAVFPFILPSCFSPLCVHFFFLCLYSDLQKGDPTLSVLELWGAEYQESNALLLRPSDRDFLERVCQREKCPVDFVGNITGDGKAGFSLGLQNLTVTHLKSH